MTDTVDLGKCPVCGNNEEIIHNGPEHWGACHTHRLRWRIGSNILPGWQQGNPMIWFENWKRISLYEDVRLLPSSTKQ